jgi:hypothetical protein
VRNDEDHINIGKHEKEEWQRRTSCLLPKIERELVLWMTRVAFDEDALVEGQMVEC